MIMAYDCHCHCYDIEIKHWQAREREILIMRNQRNLK